MKTRFEVIDMTSSRRTHLGERDTFDAAEHFARWHAARRNIRVIVWRTQETPRHRHSEEMASITRDALGRLWTDLSWAGSELI